MPPTTKQHHRIAGLDGIRALAVISVVLTHYGALAALDGTALMPLVHGTTGVRVFFVLSGFLITRLLLTEHRESGQISYRNFVARRALRIFPLYFLFLSLPALLYVFGVWHTKPEGMLYAWLYAYNFVPPALYDPLLAHTWSLAVEEHFYLLWPLALLFLVSRQRALFVFIGLAALASFISFVLLKRVVQVHGVFLERWTIVAAFSLLVGCFAASVSHFKPHSVFAEFSRSSAGFCAAVLLFATPSLLHLWPALAERVVPAYTAASMQSVAIAIFLQWIAARPQAGLVSALEWRPLRYIGTISYGIYIWQGFFLGVSPLRDADSTWPPNPALGLVGIAVFAPLSYHFFEKRFLAMKVRFAGARANVASPQARPGDRAAA